MNEISPNQNHKIHMFTRNHIHNLVSRTCYVFPRTGLSLIINNPHQTLK